MANSGTNRDRGFLRTKLNNVTLVEYSASLPYTRVAGPAVHRAEIGHIVQSTLRRVFQCQCEAM